MGGSNIKWIILGVFFAAALAPAVYFYDRYQNVQAKLSAAGRPAAETAAELEQLVGKHMSLPKEAPSIARVSDSDALADQEFFKSAKVGDRVLIYKNAKLAVLYRPSSDKIINVGPITVDHQEPEKQTTPAGTVVASTPVSATVYNATQTPGHAKTYKEKVEKANANIKVSSLGDSVKSYSSDVVIDITGKNATVAAALAKSLGATVAPLATGERRPTTDLLIIAGK